MKKSPFNFFLAEFHSKYFGLLWVKIKPSYTKRYTFCGYNKDIKIH